MKNFHIILRHPYDLMLKKIAEKLWSNHGNDGDAFRYQSQAIRHCIKSTYEAMFGADEPVEAE